jgi:hypothetical protein
MNIKSLFFTLEGWGVGKQPQRSQFRAAQNTEHTDTQSNQRINVFYFCSPKRYRKKSTGKKARVCIGGAAVFHWRAARRRLKLFFGESSTLLLSQQSGMRTAHTHTLGSINHRVRHQTRPAARKYFEQLSKPFLSPKLFLFCINTRAAHSFVRRLEK